MKSGWEVNSWEEAWLKVVGAHKEDPEQTERDVQHILGGMLPFADGFYRALEIGAGYGRLVYCMADKFHKVVGVDSSQAMIDLSAVYLRGLPNAEMVKGPGSSLPAPSESFDFIYSYVAFQHMHTLEIIRNYVAEAFRVLRPGGLCRIQTIKGKSNPSMVEGGLHRCHLFEDEKDFLQLFLDAGFEATVEVGVSHFQHIWVTGRKPC